MIFIDVHTHNFNSKNCIAVYSFDISEFETPINNYFTIGIHPWKISHDWETQLSRIKEFSKHPYCIGIGEAGLDRMKEPELSIQEEVFIKQIEISEELGLPLVLHVVRAYEKILEIHKKLNPKSPWVVHDFYSSIEIARQFWKKNIYTSYGEKLFISPKIQHIFYEAPIEFCFLETDESLLPIQKVYEIAASKKDIPLYILGEKIAQNFQMVFKKANL